ncbi:MAG: 50S ribosomal protein L17 [Patescibacteria group bacterium]|jgi:large subunit ribosomal protein L17|nr:50S ribosomal protein L17 [Patescibacteria group bacterium]
MHRHGYKGRKLGRQRDQRNALIKGLASNMIENGSITTTTPKAKEVVPYLEKLITKAKKGDLHNRRLVIAKLANVDSGHKLVDEIAPKLKGRDSGHLRITKQSNRRGDNASMATVSFVDDISSTVKPAESIKAKVASKPNETKVKSSDKPKPVAKQAVVKKDIATHTNKTASRAKGVTKGDR